MTPADARISAAVAHAAELAAEQKPRKERPEPSLTETTYEDRDPEKRRQ